MCSPTEERFDEPHLHRDVSFQRDACHGDGSRAQFDLRADIERDGQNAQIDHATVSQSNGHTTNGITASGVNYLQMDNAWKVSPLSPRDNQARSDENLRNAKTYVCQTLPDGTIDGVAVANYRTRTECEDAVVESRIAISKASGLAIEVYNDIDTGDGKKSHYSTRYSYTGIHAPSVQK